MALKVGASFLTGPLCAHQTTSYNTTRCFPSPSSFSSFLCCSCHCRSCRLLVVHFVLPTERAVRVSCTPRLGSYCSDIDGLHKQERYSNRPSGAVVLSFVSVHLFVALGRVGSASSFLVLFVLMTTLCLLTITIAAIVVVILFLCSHLVGD